MSYSLCLLTASCMAVGQSSYYPAGPTSAQPIVMPAAPVETDSGTHLSLRERFWNFWHRRDTVQHPVHPAYPTRSEVVYPRAAQEYPVRPSYPTASEVEHTAEPPLLQPTPRQPLPSDPVSAYPEPSPSPEVSATPVETGDAEGSGPTTVTTQKPVYEVSKPLENKVGAAEDYSWITGQLFYVHAEGGRWVLRYASVGQVDRYGGSVVLAPGVEMRNFREGDVVCVHGQVLNEGRTSPHLGGALYRPNSIEMIERADPATK